MTKLINIDGIDCCGKSTLSKSIMDKFKKDGLKAMVQHFPRYDTVLGKTIKDKLYSGEVEDIQELFLQDQINFSKEFKDGKYSEYDIVILDRYFISSSVYEGAVHGPHSKERENLLKKQIKAINKSILLVPSYNLIVAMFESYHHDIIKERLDSKNNKDSMETLDKLEVANTLYMSTYFLNPYELNKNINFKLFPIITNENIENLTNEIILDVKKL